MSGFFKCDSGITDSSLWAIPPDERIVFLTLLAKADADGVAHLSVSGLQRAANVPMESVERALAQFEAPDPDSRNPENDGRRIKRVPGGFIVLNYVHYRERDYRIERREYMRQYMAKRRADVNKTANKEFTGANPMPLPLPSDNVNVNEDRGVGEGFEKFWDAYPKKEGRDAALDAFKKHVAPNEAELLPKILAALAWQCEKRDWTKDEGRWIPSAAKYLADEVWKDSRGKPYSHSDGFWPSDRYDHKKGF